MVVEERVGVDINSNLNINVTGGARAAAGPVAGGRGVADPTAMAPGGRGGVAAVEQSRARAMQVKQESQAWGALSNSLLQVNMSLLGVMFGYQNFTRALNANNDAELANLQMKEKKSRQDKERIRSLRKEQIEQQRMNKFMMATISLVQFTASVLQILTVIKRHSAMASMQEAQASAAATSASTAEGTAAYAAGGGYLSKNTFKAGALAPVMVGIMLAALALGVTGYMAFRAKMAATGIDVMPTTGGIPVIMGEAGQREVASPVPLLRQVQREEMTRVLDERGGAGAGATVIQNNYMWDAESGLEANARMKEFGEKIGVT